MYQQMTRRRANESIRRRIIYHRQLGKVKRLDWRKNSAKCTSVGGRVVLAVCWICVVTRVTSDHFGRTWIIIYKNGHWKIRPITPIRSVLNRHLFARWAFPPLPLVFHIRAAVIKCLRPFLATGRYYFALTKPLLDRSLFSCCRCHIFEYKTHQGVNKVMGLFPGGLWNRKGPSFYPLMTCLVVPYFALSCSWQR